MLALTQPRSVSLKSRDLKQAQELRLAPNLWRRELRRLPHRTVSPKVLAQSRQAWDS